MANSGPAGGDVRGGAAVEPGRAGEEHEMGLGVPTYDLLERPWIPVRRLGQADVDLVGLRELFTHAHELADLAVPLPPAAAGLWRVLYALTARIADLRPQEWLDQRLDLLDQGHFDPEDIEAYCGKHAGAFDLFGPRPWMQEPTLRQQCPAPSGINKLVFGRPTGSNQVWFGHFTDARPEPVPTPEAIQHLLIQHYYGPSGRCTARKAGDGQLANSTKGILRSTLSYHPVGDTLFESLLLGLPSPGDDPGGQPDDLCPWERTQPLDPLGRPPYPSWPGGLLTGRSRHAVLLLPDATGANVIDAYVTWAWREPGADVPDPYLIYQLSKENNLYGRRAEIERGLWRDLDALLRHTSLGSQPRRPQVFDGLKELPSELLNRVRIRAYGFDQDGQTREKRWLSALTPPVLHRMEEASKEAPQQIGLLREHAEALGEKLKTVLIGAWHQATATTDKAKTGPWAVRAARFYWPAAEREFWDRLAAEEIDTSPDRFRELAHDAIDAALSETDEAKRTVAKAIAAAHRNLNRKNRGKEST
ncbi:CRISPR system Cascade subunit CasA [Crossiella equi]|uniref:CRISPR system Cascade subunit CasA n=2 Tax=Crossiella equi TaxID=130796 RepID=A0ABS5AMJ8_9PSEU|nr:type I-E CRISPR-associated protein Cse1/CasA [Crossiella equi]MBP2477612.1 CRISPR system Cascade subunit CasA [Crossiella equi]